jgi:uncharacterized protein YukE
MPRKSRGSQSLDKADRRAAALKSISPSLDLGNGLTLDTYQSLMETLRDKLETYNTTLAMIDKAQHELVETERKLDDLSEHMLLGVATKFGKSSDEYGMAGGVRKTDRKRPVRQSKAVSAG